MNTIETQFRNYLDNQIGNPMYVSGEEDRDIPFTEYSAIEEDGIYFVVDGKHRFEYNCYHASLYDFELVA